MDGSKAREALAVLDRAPEIGRRETPTPGPRSLRLGWAVALGIGWPIVMALSLAIEPAPTNPEAAVPLIVNLGGWVLLLAMGATAVAAARRLPTAIGFSALAGAVALAFTISCPASGHHALAAWWFGELALTVGMLGVTLAASRRALTS
jgi:hypothetical protein